MVEDTAAEDVSHHSMRVSDELAAIFRAARGEHNVDSMCQPLEGNAGMITKQIDRDTMHGRVETGNSQSSGSTREVDSNVSLCSRLASECEQAGIPNVLESGVADSRDCSEGRQVAPSARRQSFVGQPMGSLTIVRVLMPKPIARWVSCVHAKPLKNRHQSSKAPRTKKDGVARKADRWLPGLPKCLRRRSSSRAGSEAVDDEDAEQAFRALRELLKRDTFRVEPLSLAPAELLPHLFLGSANQARDLLSLQRLRVTHVINCASASVHTGVEYYRPMGIEYSEFEAYDSKGYKILQHYYKMAAIADAVAMAKGRLLVHCEAGVNRSGTLCLAYYAAHTGQSLLASARFCKAQRGRICTNPAFQVQIFQFAQSHRLPLH